MKLLFAILTYVLFLFATAYADSPADQGIILYEQPDAKSKIVGAIAPGNALIPIFSQNNWIKVADPSNGNVGWISNEALKQPNLPVVRTYTQTEVTPNSQNYRVIQSNGANGIQAIDEKQVQVLFQNWQIQQKNIQDTLNQILNQSIADFNTLLRNFNEQESRLINTPLMQPLIIVPNSTSPKEAPNTIAPTGK